MRLIASIGAIVLLIGSCAANHDFLTNSLNECVKAESWISCLKHQVLNCLDDKLGTTTEARSLETVDEAIVARSVKYMKSFDYGIDLPFVDASLKYRPSRSLVDLDVEFKDNDVATNQARGLLKKKLLLPFLLLLKLKLKALMPIFVAIIGLKALKALVLSKLALLVVIGFVALQLFKKGGMMMPTGMSIEPASTYGAPMPSTTSSYEPVNTWDGNGPYSRVWTPTNGVEAQNLAYSYYSPGSSSGSYNSAGASSSSSSSSSNGSTNYN
ncbi:hypothetical protein ACFW04_006628 [Cataglyphis niger]